MTSTPTAVSSEHETKYTAKAMTLLRTVTTFPVLTVMLPLLAGEAALAQTDAERLEALRACLDIESDAARLLCFESIVRAEPSDSEASGGRALATAANEAFGLTTDAERPDAPAASGPGEETADETGDPVADAPERIGPAPAQTDDARAADVSRERLREEEAAETILVVEAGRGFRGNAIFAIDDGRRFLQTSGNTARVLPAAPFEAMLEDGAFGSVFLVARSAGLRVRVREETE